MKYTDLFEITALPVTLASLCCLGPLVLVALGLSTVSFAASLADTFYGEYKWAFRSAGIFTLLLSLVVYWRSKGVCTIDQAKRQRNKILNMVLLSMMVAIVGYMLFLHVVVHYAGVWLDIWV